MSNTLVFDYAVSISEAQSASKVDYGFLNNCLVLVDGNYAELSSFSVVIAKPSLHAGGVTFATATNPIPSGAKLSDITWVSSDESVARIDGDGVITPLSEGTYTITATDTATGITATATGNVTAEVIDSGAVSLDTTEISTNAAVGTVITATATIEPDNDGVHVHYEWLLTGDATGGLGLVWDNETDGSSATITVLEGFDQNAGGTVTVTCSANGTDLTSADLTVTYVEPSVQSTRKVKKKSVEMDGVFTDPSKYKVVPIYEPTSFADYTDNTDVPFFMVGGLNTVYLLIKAEEINPANSDDVIDFDPTNYFTLCHSSDTPLEIAKYIKFADFKGVTVYATNDLTKAEELSKTDAVFYDAGGSYAGAYEQFGYFLTQVYWRNNQYYVLDGDNPASTITALGEADSLFEKRISFYLNGSGGPTLGFFGCAGEAITKTYLNKLIQLETQEAITSYIQVNEPNDTAVQRINIEEAAMAVIEKYEGYPYFYLDADKNNYIHILKSDDMYFVDGEAEIKIADPIWRAQIQVKEAQ